MPTVQKATKTPRLVNRGAAGLLRKLPSADHEATPRREIKAPINHIAPALKHLIVDISTLTADPDNARAHPERNIEAIKDSLKLYSQLRPITARKKGKEIIVLAGNGTLQSAIELGWTKIAAIIHKDLNDIQAVGFGIADNRTAELAQWKWDVLKRLNVIMEDAKEEPVGWTFDELAVLRVHGDWVPPEVNGDTETYHKPLLIGLTPDEMEPVSAACNKLREMNEDYRDLSDGACVACICKQWVEL